MVDQKEHADAEREAQEGDTPARGQSVVSNVFMTFAWYAHLKELNHKPWLIAALLSWAWPISRSSRR